MKTRYYIINYYLSRFITDGGLTQATQRSVLVRTCTRGGWWNKVVTQEWALKSIKGTLSH